MKVRARVGYNSGPFAFVHTKTSRFVIKCACPLDFPFKEGRKVRELTISDIHGCAKQFRRLLELLGPIRSKDKLILLGDYFDRGPASSEVYQLILELISLYGDRVKILLGNHEDMLFDFLGLESLRTYKEGLWYKHNGGLQTKNSFHVDDLLEAAIWLRAFGRLEYRSKTAKYIHAGPVNPDEERWQMLWRRDLESMPPQPQKLIIGHTPASEFPRSLRLNNAVRINKRAPYFDKKHNFIVVDNGCVYGDGPLLAYDVRNDVAYYSDGVIIEKATE